MHHRNVIQGIVGWGRLLFVPIIVVAWRTSVQGAELSFQDRIERCERTVAATEEKLGKMGSYLKSELAKAAQDRQDRKDDVQGFLRSQATLDTKLDELATEVRLAHGRTEEIGLGISELNRRVDGFGDQFDQFGRRLTRFENIENAGEALVDLIKQVDALGTQMQLLVRRLKKLEERVSSGQSDFQEKQF